MIVDAFDAIIPKGSRKMAPRATERLTALKVEKAKAPGMYADGGGLYLRVTPDGAKNWVLRYMLDRRPRWMGLGPLALYGLADARAKALDARRGATRLSERGNDLMRPMPSRSSNALRHTSPPTAPVVKSTSTNGRPPLTPTPILLSAGCLCRRWTPR
jgi:hypothetical protein